MRAAHCDWALSRLLLLHLLISSIAASAAVNCPKTCRCSWVLDSLGVNCSRSGLTQLPNFDNLPIDHLDLSGNHFAEFPSELADIESLIHLDLSSNQISYIDKYALLGFNALRTLKLANNSFAGWGDLNPRQAFNNAVSLKSLTLSDNALGSFTDLKPSEVLVSKSLSELELERCGITTVSGDHLINGLPNLERLALSGNRLTTLNVLPSDSLRSLELRNCNLQRINPLLLQDLPSLESLDVAWNAALQFGDYLEVPQLRNLDLSFNNLDRVNLGGMPALATLSLRGNMLRSVDAETFANNTQLQSIDLARNSLRSIQSDAFAQLTRLATIDLSYNEIARLDRNLFRANDALIALNLSRNVIEKFTKLVSNSLRDINLSWCEIIAIEATAFSGLSAIQRLDLSNTLIRSFPAGMRSETLKVLNLSNCRLSAIHNNTFSGFPELASLYLSGNRFTTPIPTEYFRSNKYLDAIWIEDNPWICNCHDPAFMEFYEFLVAKPPKLKNRNSVRCASPSSLYGRTWESACALAWTRSDTTSNAEKVWTAIMLTIAALGVLVCLYSCFKRYIKSRKRDQDRQEYRQNRAEMMEIRLQNQRMLLDSGTPNAPDPSEILPSYEDAIRMPKLERPIKSMVDLTDSSRSRKKLRRTRTADEPVEEEDDDGLLLDNRQRFRSEEMLSNRDKERTAHIDPFRRTGYVEYNASSRRFSIEDSRFPAAHLKSQNLQSAEQIGNFQGYDHSPYTKRRPHIADIPPFKRATLLADSVEFLTDPEFDAASKPSSPFARRKPKTPTSPSSETPLAPAVEDYFGAAQKSRSSSMGGSDFHVVIEPDVSSLPDRDNSSSSEAETNAERGKRKKRKNSTSRRASGNFNAAAAAAAGDSSSSDRDPIVVVHKPMRETLF